MGSLDAIMRQLDEREIARQVGLPHDEARMAYALRKNTVNNFSEFTQIIGDYYSYHFVTCVSGGGALPRAEAEGRAKEILEKKYHERGSTLQGAYADAQEGTNGGLRNILDLIAEQMKYEAVERYIRKVLDDQIDPTSWEDKVSIVRQFIARCGADLAPSIDARNPERYAKDYTELIRSYVNALSRTSAIFRRM
jgi:hypothetical protein